MPVCPNCQSNQPDGVAFCDECGAPLSALVVPVPAGPAPISGAQTVMANLCSTCGAQVLPGTPFCDNCGAALDPPGAQNLAAGQAYPSSSASVCPACGSPVEAGSHYCDMCGSPMSSIGSVPSGPGSGSGQPGGDIPPVIIEDGSKLGQTFDQQQSRTPPPQTWSESDRYAGVQGRLIVQGTGAAIPLTGGKHEVFVGREDPISGCFPDVDLTNHGGDEGGVSRKHARLFVQGGQLMLEDLNSTNFTYVNQQKLGPQQPHPLHDGDELRFGRVKLVYSM